MSFILLHAEGEDLGNEIINLVIKIMYGENGAVKSFGKLFSNSGLPETEKKKRPTS